MDKQQLVAGYYRVSVARDDMKAPELYEDEITRYCRFRDLELAEIFSDIDYSGYNNSEKRPALNDLVARRSEFSAVIIPKLSRFGRSLKHLTELFDVFDRDGIALVFLDLGMDLTTSQGRLLRNVMGAFAEYESDVRSDYARANHRLARIQGKAATGTPPYGYLPDRPNRSYSIDPEQAAVVREIFDMYAAGATVHGIAKAMNSRGVPRPSGKPWRASRLSYLLDNPAYAALNLVDDELVPARWQPIVDTDTWEEVRALRRAQARRNRARKNPRKHPHLLSGLIECGTCGGVVHHRQRPNGRFYICAQSYKAAQPHCDGGSITAQAAEATVVEHFLARARFGLVDVDGGERSLHFSSSDLTWNAATLDERRELLRIAIRRVVLPPWPEGRHVPGTRTVLVEWADSEGPVTDELVFTALRPPARSLSRPEPDARAERLRRTEERQDETAVSLRSQRAKARRAEWSAFRDDRILWKA